MNLPDDVIPLKVKQYDWASADEPDRTHHLELILKNLSEGCALDVSCWCEGVDPDQIRQAMVDDPDVKFAIMHASARGERELQRKVLQGDMKALPPAKAALEVLVRTNASWGGGKSGLTKEQFDEAVSQLARNLDEDTLAKVLRVFATVKA